MSESETGATEVAVVGGEGKKKKFFTRRRTFVFGGGAAVVTTGATALGLRLFSGYPDRPQGYAMLSKHEVVTIEALADTLFPAYEDMPSASSIGIAKYVDRHFEMLSATNRMRTRALFWVFEHATLPFGGHMRRFSSLNAEDRLKYLQRWQSYDDWMRRSLFFALRGLLGFSYYSHLRVERLVGIEYHCHSASTLHRPEDDRNPVGT